jgi:DNA-binding beta-propeller fold protein YncE/thiol-disulfide isomerase/thioredoxin
VFASLLLAAVTFTVYRAQGQRGQEGTAMLEYQGQVDAPDFPPGLQWLNAERPLSLRELRGKIVLLDFWTYCCINCMHIIPDFKRLEKKYANEMVVIGVHSAKFTAERDTDNIRQAILRYGIEHPVVNDRDLEVWRQYGVRAWPTVMLIDPTGKLVGYFSGEGVYDPFDALIAKMIAVFDGKGQIDRRPLRLKLERQRVPESLLAFPGKVLADDASKRLFVADSNHNRIVVLSLPNATVMDVIGSGEEGMQDGSFEQAAFNHPQGMALDGNLLYVADTENHAIRRVDFAGRAVATVAGSGEQARGLKGGGPGRSTPLSSPWDLVAHGGALYVAMAGSHQIWRMDLKTNAVSPYAGSGLEGLTDGTLTTAALAQPSGITTDGETLYVADSEVSAVRAIALEPTGRVETLIGEDLFEFGDRDGDRSVARLQHPLGVAYHDGAVYVADTYNNKIKRISLHDRVARTFVGTGGAGLRDGDAATLNEPGGLSVAAGKLYVADTDNHSIRVVDLRSREVETLQIQGIERLRPRTAAARFRGDTVELHVQSVEPGEATLTLGIELPPGYKLNAEAPSVVTIDTAAPQLVSFNDGVQEQSFRRPQFPLNIPVTVREGQANMQAHYLVYYCDAYKERLCYFKEAKVNLPIEVRKGAGTRRLEAAYQLPAPSA